MYVRFNSRHMTNYARMPARHSNKVLHSIMLWRVVVYLAIQSCLDTCMPLVGKSSFGAAGGKSEVFAGCQRATLIYRLFNLLPALYCALQYFKINFLLKRPALHGTILLYNLYRLLPSFVQRSHHQQSTARYLN